MTTRRRSGPSTGRRLAATRSRQLGHHRLGDIGGLRPLGPLTPVADPAFRRGLSGDQRFTGARDRLDDDVREAGQWIAAEGHPGRDRATISCTMTCMRTLAVDAGVLQVRLQPLIVCGVEDRPDGRTDRLEAEDIELVVNCPANECAAESSTEADERTAYAPRA